MTESSVAGGTIIVSTPRHWVGNQALGAFSIYLDGAKVGVLAPEGTLRLPCAPGHHTMRARQWWYMSPRIELDVIPEASRRVECDLARRDSTLARFLRLMFSPWRGIVLSPDGSVT
jgi:hypothetical protein